MIKVWIGLSACLLLFVIGASIYDLDNTGRWSDLDMYTDALKVFRNVSLAIGFVLFVLFLLWKLFLRFVKAVKDV